MGRRLPVDILSHGQIEFRRMCPLKIAHHKLCQKESTDQFDIDSRFLEYELSARNSGRQQNRHCSRSDGIGGKWPPTVL